MDSFIIQLIHIKIQVNIIQPAANIQMIQLLASIQMFDEYMPGDIGGPAFVLNACMKNWHICVRTFQGKILKRYIESILLTNPD